jgi:hypothetical protein
MNDSDIEDMDLDKLEEEWKKSEKKAKEFSESWEKFFKAKKVSQSRPLNEEDTEMAKITEVIEKHELEILNYPNVVGVGVGYRIKSGKPMDELCLVVYVEKKVPKAELLARDIIPEEIDGVKLDVVETGRIEAL